MTSWSAQERRVEAQADTETQAAHAGLVIATEQLTQSDPLPAWPLLDSAALCGFAGDVVGALAPHTEADPVALLIDLLVGFGAMVGSGPHIVVGADKHPAQLFAALVGETAKARKGSAWSMVRAVLTHTDARFMSTRVLGGFGSGEALVDELGDASEHRLLVRESEFARILTVAGREGSTLSMTIRDAWDGRRLESRTRGRRAVSVEHPHVAVLADCTEVELRAKLAGLEIANGFANRFLFVCVRDSKTLPDGGQLDQAEVNPLGNELRRRLAEARKRGILHRSDAAAELWRPLYFAMKADVPGDLLAAVTARDAAQMLRLQVTYALLAGSRWIEPQHIEAAWAVWRYCRASAEHIFGGLGSPVVERLATAIRDAGERGLDATAQNRLFSSNRPSSEVEAMRQELEALGLVHTVKEPTGGRPRVVSRWVAHDALGNGKT